MQVLTAVKLCAPAECRVTHIDAGTTVHPFLLGLDITRLRSVRHLPLGSARAYADRAELIRCGRIAPDSTLVYRLK